MANLRIVPAPFLLNPPGSRGSPAHFVSNNARSTPYRGARVPCRDEPAEFDDNGAIITKPDDADPSIRREGWVEVHPYWESSPTATVRVCAFDAQENETGIEHRRGIEVNCNDNWSAPECGCGLNLRWCQSVSHRTRDSILDSMSEQTLRFATQIVAEDRPYTELIRGTDIEVNGPLSHWLRHQTFATNVLLTSGPSQNYEMPVVRFHERNRWVKAPRGSLHAGVLTMPAYLLKFQSDRGRANRFYDVFLCQHFESSDPPPDATDACHQEPDLTQRCGCKGCHVTVEPAAAYWGRWAEAGLMALEVDKFPRVQSECSDGSSRFCRTFYFNELAVMNALVGGPYVGTLRSYVFADEARKANIERGPSGIAEKAIESGNFFRCTTRRIWSKLMARLPQGAEVERLDEVAEAFRHHDNLRDLIRALVKTPEYIDMERWKENLE